MNINPEYIKALLSVEMLKHAYKNGKPLPLVAQKFIEMGADLGFKIEIKYGTITQDDCLMAGYFINAPEFGKTLFCTDTEIENENEENIEGAVNWFKKALNNLVNLKKQLQ